MYLRIFCRAQLDKLDAIREKRRANFARFKAGLQVLAFGAEIAPRSRRDRDPRSSASRGLLLLPLMMMMLLLLLLLLLLFPPSASLAGASDYSAHVPTQTIRSTGHALHPANLFSYARLLNSTGHELHPARRARDVRLARLPTPAPAPRRAAAAPRVQQYPGD